MPTRNISLTREQDTFVERLVDSGDYQNASEAIRDGLRALQQRRREDELRLRALKAQLASGVVALERGDFVDVRTDDLEGFMRTLVAAPPTPSPSKAARRAPPRRTR